MTSGVATLRNTMTPCLVLDADRMDANIARLEAHLAGFNVSLRPHLKTAKSIEVARRMMRSPGGPATVSTLKEAQAFAAAGVTDMVYAVGITPDKLAAVLALRSQGIDLAVILDSPEQAEFVSAAGGAIPALIEIDCDGHRSGVAPDDDALLITIAQRLGAGLRGVLTHAGDSYGAYTPEARRAFAETERSAVVHAAATLRAAGYPCPVVSVGSTPTAFAADNLDGVTEVRAGVYVFFDLVIAGIGTCSVDEIALSVLATVIGHQPNKGWILVDAGWMALSRDRGTAKQAVDQGYGLVSDLAGRPYGDLIVTDANQEHGIVALRAGSSAALPALAIGDRLRILPNHACATAAQHDRYHVIRGTSDRIETEWSRFGGW